LESRHRIAEAGAQSKFFPERVRAPVKLRFMTAQSRPRQINFATAAAIWAAVLLFAAVAGSHLGYSGPRFFVALGVAGALFGFELFLAVPSVLGAVYGVLGQRAGVLAVLVPLFAILIYSMGVSGNWKYMLVGAGYAVVPALLLASSAGKPPGTCSDYVAVALIWLPVEFRWMYRLFPFPPQLTHTLTILMALSTGVAAFVVLRRLDRVGYAIEWRRGTGANILIHFMVFIAIAVPLGIAMRFLAYDPEMARLRSLPLAVIGITLFTAWPEEFLFRGVLQNLFSKTLNNQWAGLAIASVVFGLSHIIHAPFPNWKYVILATIAGLFYGHAWMKSGSLLPGAIVHALVDISWHLLFR
jgi:membrane protease YdiL (CAAX protease family)